SPPATTTAAVLASALRLAHLVAELLALVQVELPGVGEFLAVHRGRGTRGSCLRRRLRCPQDERARSRRHRPQDHRRSHLSILLAASSRSSSQNDAGLLV